MITRNSSRIAIALRICVALSGLLGLSSAQAMSFCVGNVTLLKAALALGEIQSEPYTIMITQGMYVMDADMIYELSAPTTIEGGYTTNCVSRVVNPANTMINIGLDHYLDWSQKAASPQAQLNIDGVIFANSDQGVSFQAGDHGIFNDEGSVHLSNLRFMQITNQIFPVLNVLSYNGSTDIENVVIDHVSTTADCGLRLYSEGHSIVRVNHLTADLAAGDDLCLDDSGQETQFSIYNSILWNSDGGQSIFRTDSAFTPDPDTTVAMINNVMHGYHVDGVPIQQNAIFSDPRWIDAAAGNYHLKTNPLSPAINSGTWISPGGEPATDIEGLPRIVGSAPDRGAYESAFNNQSVLIVSNTQDSGIGSLRQAMIEANSSPAVAKLIKFDIRGAGNVPVCPAVIALSSALPAVAAPMSIDGYTQPFSTANTDANAFNANLCVIVKPASGVLPVGFHIPAAAPDTVSLTLRGLGLGGFSQPALILGGQGHLIAGNQFGGSANGVTLPGAALNAVAIGVNATGSLIVGGSSLADRNVIGGAGLGGVNIQSGVHSSTDRCQIVNNLIGLGPNGHTELANSVGINAVGSGCGIVRNRVAGNQIANIWLNGSSENVVQQNMVGITTQNGGLLNSAIGVLVTGSGNIIGAGGNGGVFTANTIRFMVGGGVVIRGDVAGNSVQANLIYDNGPTGNGMDIDLQPTNAAAGPTSNDASDADVGPNYLQNFPVANRLTYTSLTSAWVSGVLDTQPGLHRIDAYFSSSANPSGKRGHAEIFVGQKTINVFANDSRTQFSVPIEIPNQFDGSVISLTATDEAGNTSEIGTALPIDALLVDGFD